MVAAGPLDRWAGTQAAPQETERRAYVTVPQLMHKNVGSPTGREPYGDGALVVVRGRPLRTINMRSWYESAWPWLDVIERHMTTDTLKVPLVPGYEHATRLTTRQCQQDIVRERLRHSADLEPLLSCHVREQIARTMPGTRGGRECPPGSLEHAEYVSLKRLTVPLPPHPGSQLLGHNDTEILEGSERSMELLQGLVGSWVAKCVNEELRVQNVLAGRLDHGSRSGDAISTPSMARVPSTSSR